jgi:hypothetical protein
LVRWGRCLSIERGQWRRFHRHGRHVGCGYRCEVLGGSGCGHVLFLVCGHVNDNEFILIEFSIVHFDKLCFDVFFSIDIVHFDADIVFFDIFVLSFAIDVIFSIINLLGIVIVVFIDIGVVLRDIVFRNIVSRDFLLSDAV